jgi:hypothetical protein
MPYMRPENYIRNGDQVQLVCTVQYIRFFVSSEFNLARIIIIAIVYIHPVVQQYEPRSAEGLPTDRVEWLPFINVELGEA